MINRIITWSLEHRLLVVAVSLIVVAAGLWSLLRLPIDAYPDTTPVLVQVNAIAPALSPLEIEQQVTFPVEQVMMRLIMKGYSALRLAPGSTSQQPAPMLPLRISVLSRNAPSVTIISPAASPFSTT